MDADAVLYTLRTEKMPFLQSKPSLPMFLVTGLTVAAGTIIPYTKLALLLISDRCRQNFGIIYWWWYSYIYY